jgi:hypothetical protein
MKRQAALSRVRTSAASSVDRPWGPNHAPSDRRRESKGDTRVPIYRVQRPPRRRDPVRPRRRRGRLGEGGRTLPPGGGGRPGANRARPGPAARRPPTRRAAPVAARPGRRPSQAQWSFGPAPDQPAPVRRRKHEGPAALPGIGHPEAAAVPPDPGQAGGPVPGRTGRRHCPGCSRPTGSTWTRFWPTQPGI